MIGGLLPLVQDQQAPVSSRLNVSSFVPADHHRTLLLGIGYDLSRSQNDYHNAADFGLAAALAGRERRHYRGQHAHAVSIGLLD